MQDLAQCPNGFVSLTTRTCPGNNWNTDAGGKTYSFPTSSSSATELQQMVEALVYLATNNSREIFLTILIHIQCWIIPLLAGQRELRYNRIE